MTEYTLVIGCVSLCAITGVRALGEATDAKIKAQAACVRDLNCSGDASSMGHDGSSASYSIDGSRPSTTAGSASMDSSLDPVSADALPRIDDPFAALQLSAVTIRPPKQSVVDQCAHMPLSEFSQLQSSPERDERVNWESDGCSAPIGGGPFGFTRACARHDFNYRNYKAMGAFEDKKAIADEQFLQDMKDECRSKNVVLRPSCTSYAYAYYGAVKLFRPPKYWKSRTATIGSGD